MKIRQRIAVLAGACTLAAGLAAAPVNAENPPTPARPAARLNCQPIVQGGAPAAACEWSLKVETPVTVELWRGKGESGDLERVKVLSTTDPSVKRHVDATVETGNRYRYVLLILGPEGNERGRSNLAGASFVPPEQIEHLRLACARTAPTTVRCQWGEPASDTAATLQLFVLVDRGARTVLTTIDPAAGGSFDYPVPAESRLLRFGVVSYDADGAVDGRSRVVPVTLVRPRR